VEFTTLAVTTTIPTLTTEAVSDITETTATTGGNITDDGGSDITARGVCYSTSPNPTIDDNTTNDGTGAGTFTSNLTGLTPDTTYYVRAYATNSEGTAYGDEVQFTTLNSNGNNIFPGQTVYVEGGTFEMGSENNANEQPVHTVTVNNFYISKYEITTQQYVDFLNEVNAIPDGDEIKYDDKILFNIQYSNINYENNVYSCDTGYENYPMINVFWEGAKLYCEYYGGRLPTEAEWEYAARGGKYSVGHLYSGSNILNEVGWYVDNCESFQPIGEKMPNELGLYDMSGNVTEWCNDWYDADYYDISPEYNPLGPSTGTYKVIRGGTWMLLETECTVSRRGASEVDHLNGQDGFRPVFDQ